METKTLFPGINLNVQREDRFKSEYLSVNFILSGKLYERAHASLLSPVMLCGCEKYPNEQSLESALLDLYDADLFCDGYALGESFIKPFALTCPIDRYLPQGANVRGEARDLLFEFMLHPLVSNGGFKKKNVANQKKNRLDRLKGEKTDRPRYATRKCFELLFEGEDCVYTTAQYKKDLKSVTPESLYAFYQKMLSRAQIEIFYFGPEEPSALEEDLRTRLAPLFTPKDELTKDVVSVPKNAVKRGFEALPGQQSTLCIGYKTPVVMGHPDYTALCLAREMLCLSPSSLIFSNVREKQSLCYYCADRLLPRKGGYILFSGIDGAAAEKAERAIDEQFESLKNGDFDERLFLESKRMMTNGLLAMYDSPQATEGWYMRRRLAEGNGTPEQTIEAIAALKREDVLRAAQSFTKDCVFLLKNK